VAAAVSLLLEVAGQEADHAAAHREQVRQVHDPGRGGAGHSQRRRTPAQDRWHGQDRRDLGGDGQAE
jgi:hypothetical protein